MTNFRHTYPTRYIQYLHQLIQISKESDLHIVQANTYESKKTDFILAKLSKLNIPNDAYRWIAHNKDYLELDFSIEDIVALIRILVELSNQNVVFFASGNSLRDLFGWLRIQGYKDKDVDALGDWASGYATHRYIEQNIHWERHNHWINTHPEEVRLAKEREAHAKLCAEASEAGDKAIREAEVAVADAKQRLKQAHTSKERLLSIAELAKLAPIERLIKIASSDHSPYYYPCDFLTEISEKEAHSLPEITKQLLLSKIIKTTSRQSRTNSNAKGWKEFVAKNLIQPLNQTLR